MLRAKQGPPPTEEEQAILAAAAHKPVELFTEVLVTDLTYGDQITYTIVPDGEGDPDRNRVSLGSPIGRTLFREYPGAVVEVKTPGGKLLYRILRVR